MNIKKAIIVVLCLSLFLSGCAKQTTTITSSNSNSQIKKASANKINLIYCSKDTLDPYSCATEQNLILSQLIFDTLVDLDENYSPANSLAENVTVNGNECYVKIRNAKFSDGSTVTANDVIFSFNKAKSSNNYKTALKFVTSAVSTDSQNIIFKLSRNDKYFANLLTFPIMKAGSDSLKNSDNKTLPPIGNGRYVFDISTNTLKQNEYYYGNKSAITEIAAIDCPDNESVSRTIETGAVDFYFTDLTDNVIPKMNGNSADVPVSRMLFLGVNPNSPRLSNVYFRQAVSAALNRAEICENAYFSKAEPALGPFPASWKPSENCQNILSKPDLSTTESNINHAGFTQKDKNGIFIQNNGNPITLTLLVNKENSSKIATADIIKSNLKDAGIGVNIYSCSKSEYNGALSAGNYDIYLGEIKFSDNLDLGGLCVLNSAKSLSSFKNASSLIKQTTSSKDEKTKASENNNTSSGTSSTASTSSEPPLITLTTLDAYNGFYSGKYNIADLITAFNAELPVIPVCFKKGLVIYSEKLGDGITPGVSDVFHGIENLQ